MFVLVMSKYFIQESRIWTGFSLIIKLALAGKKLSIMSRMVLVRYLRLLLAIDYITSTLETKYYM